MISDDEIEKAAEYLRDNAGKAAKAKATRIYLLEFRKALKAQLMKEHVTEALGSQEREAYADPRYTQHLDAMREAIERDEYYGWMKTAAEAKLEARRTLQANARAEGKAYG